MLAVPDVQAAVGGAARVDGDSPNRVGPAWTAGYWLARTRWLHRSLRIDTVGCSVIQCWLCTTSWRLLHGGGKLIWRLMGRERARSGRLLLVGLPLTVRVLLKPLWSVS